MLARPRPKWEIITFLISSSLMDLFMFFLVFSKFFFRYFVKTRAFRAKILQKIVWMNLSWTFFLIYWDMIIRNFTQWVRTLSNLTMNVFLSNFQVFMFQRATRYSQQEFLRNFKKIYISNLQDDPNEPQIEVIMEIQKLYNFPIIRRRCDVVVVSQT